LGVSIDTHAPVAARKQFRLRVNSIFFRLIREARAYQGKTDFIDSGRRADTKVRLYKITLIQPLFPIEGEGIWRGVSLILPKGGELAI